MGLKSPISSDKNMIVLGVCLWLIRISSSLTTWINMKISTLIFPQIDRKIKRNQLEIVLDATYSLHVRIILTSESKIWRKKPIDEEFRGSFKFPKRR